MNNELRRSNNIAKALKVARVAKGLSQEDFGLVSSRTYVSSLERGRKSPTLSKLDALAGHLKVHPLTLLAMAYLNDASIDSPADLLEVIRSEIDAIRHN